MTVFTKRLASESAIIRSLRANGSANPWVGRLTASFCTFLLVASCNVFGATAFPTTSGGGGGGGLTSGGSLNGLDSYNDPGINAKPPAAPPLTTATLLGAINVIGSFTSPFFAPPLQVSKSPGSVTTLAQVTVNANVNSTKSKCDGSQPTGGDPVALSTGTKVESATDFALPGEMGLSFTRYYSSSVYDEGTYASTHVGGWRTNYDYLLYIDVTQGGYCNYTSSSSLCPLVLVHPDGTVVQFGPGAANSDGSASFKELKNGIATMTRNSDGSYVIHDEDSKILTFSNTLYASTYFTLTSIKNLAGVGWTFSYPDSTDTIVTHTSGKSVSLHWTQSSSLSAGITTQLTVVDPAGKTYSYTSAMPVGTAGDIAGTRYLLGELQTVTLPTAGNPTTITYKYKNDTGGTYGFGNYQYALTEIDYNGIAHDLTSYNTAGQAVQTEMADGTEQTNITYNSNSTGPTATVTNPLGHVAVYQFDAKSNLVSITGQASAHCAASFSSRGYDANDNVSSETDNNGNVTNYTYAANGEIQQKIENPGANQRVTNYVWDTTPGTDRPLSVTVVGYLQTTFAYTPQGRLESVTQTNLTNNGVANQSRTTTYNYNLYSNGMVSSATTTFPSPNGVTTLTYNYDASGNVTSISNALGQATTYSNFTLLGDPQTVTSANGDVTNYIYDPRGRVTSVAHTHAGVTNTGYMSYDPNSQQVSQVVRPDDEVTNYSYDADFKLKSSTWTGPSGASIVKNYSYDANGDVTGVSLTKQGASSPDLVTHTTYDELGRPMLVNGNHGQSNTIGYDLNGNPTTVTDVAGNTTTNKYDAFGRLQSVIDATGKTTSYAYDTGGEVAQIVDPRGLSTTYTRDGFGGLWALQSPDTGTTTFSNDAYGRVASKTTNDGVATSFAYDALNRVTTVSAGGKSITYNYDTCSYGKGRLCGFSDPTGTTSYTYYVEGTLASRYWTDGPLSYTTNYAYDGINRPIQISEGGVFVTNYTWTDDQVSAVNLKFSGQSVNIITGVTYDAARHPTGWSYGNGVQRNQTFDNDGRITSIGSTLGSSTVQSLAYTWDNLDRVTAITNGAYPVVSQNFTYDNLYRLTGMTGPAPVTLVYDANGNRTQQNWKTNDTVTISPFNNQMTARGQHAYTYNPNGSRATDTVSGVTTTYGYDSFGFLNSVARSSAVSYCETNGTCPAYPAGTTGYATNAIGQRVIEDGPNGFELFEYGMGGQLNQETVVPNGSSTNNSNYYVYLNGTPVALVNNGATLYYIHNDHLGRPEEITNTSGSTVWLGLNYAFDRSILVNGVLNVDIGLPGQVYDSFTGNWSNGFRDYDSSDGRYLESDPTGLMGGINTYAYASGNPLSYIDPMGLNPGDPFPTASAAAIDALGYLYPITFSTSTEYAGVIYKSGISYYATIPEPGNSHFSAVFTPSQQEQYRNAGGTPVGMYHTHPYVASDRFGIEFPGNRLTTSYDSNCFSGIDTKIANFYSPHYDKPGAPSPFTSFLGTPEMIRTYTPSTGTFGQISYPW